MALIAHWPLNGNTNDISGNNYVLSNNGATIDIGKIGQCYITDGISQFFTTENIIPNTKNYFTLTFWIYPISTGYIMTPSSYGIDHRIGYDLTNQRISVGITELSDLNNRARYSTSNSVIANTWSHISIIMNDLNIRIYINGSLDSEYTETIPVAPYTGVWYWGQRSNSTNWFNGKYNDIRVYDHLLTDMEIQEIARAKILYYTFDDFQEPTTNLADTDEKRTLFKHDTGASCTFSDASERGPGWKKINITTRGTNFRIAQFPYIFQPDLSTRTYSLEVDMNSTTGYYWRIDGFTGGGSDDGSNGKVEITKALNGSSGNLAIFLNHNTTSTTGLDDTIYYRYYQVEDKAYATIFTEDSRTGRINDYSGFFNHSNALTEANTPRWAADAKIGTGAYLFNNKVIVGPGPFHISSDRLTLCAWVKPTGTHSDDRGIVIQQNGNYYLTVTPTQQVSVYWYDTSNPGYHTTTETLPLNQWSHLASVWNGTHNLIYINGLLVKATATNTPGRTIGGSPLTIGRETTNRQFIGYIDDVRQYATALSDKDIKDLYEARAEIEQSGVLYARDLLSNAEETVNLAYESMYNRIGGTTTVTILNGDEFTWKRRFEVISADYNTVNIPCKPDTYYTYSFYARYIAETSGKPNMYFKDNTQAITYHSVPLTSEWKRYSLTILTSPTATYIDRASIHTSPLGAGYIFEIADWQVEEKQYYTPFTRDYRPAIQLPATLDFSGNEVHETGTANFEDFSTVGITDGLVGYWNLDKDLRDFSGNNYIPTNYGATFDGESIYFNGSTYITLPYGDNINPSTNPQSFSMMIKKTASTDTIFFTTSQSGDANARMYIRSGTNDGLNLGIQTSGTGGTEYANSLSLNDWHYIVVTMDGSNAKLYLDGSLLNTKTYTSYVFNQDIQVGQHDGSYRLTGNIKNIKVFNRALTPEEIAIEYNTIFNNEVQIHESGVLYAKDIKQY